MMERKFSDKLPVIIKNLLEKSQDIMYYLQLKPTLQFLYVNDAVTRITGFTPQEHYENPNLGFEIVYPEDRPKLTELLEKGEGFNRPIELRWQNKLGDPIWTEQINSPIFDEKGEIVAIVGTARDITRRHLAEMEIERLRGYLPICAACKKIRNDLGYWEEVEHYVTEHSDAMFTHSICPDCAAELIKENDLDDK